MNFSSRQAGLNLKIVHIITRLIIGGAQENTLLSCEGQHDLGHEVTLVTGPGIGPEGSLMARAQGYGYRVIALDGMRRAIRPMADVGVYRDLKNQIRHINPDVVHTHSSKAGIIGRWAAHRAGAKCIIHTIHGLAFTASTRAMVNAVYTSLERWTAPISTRIVCVADAMAEQSLAAGIGRAEQYVTIYSGMETGTFVHPPVGREQVRKSLGIEDHQVVVGTIARLFDLKGHDDLLGLAPELCRRFPELRFLWVGDGLLRGRFEERMTAMGLRERFVLTGMVPPGRVPELMGAMDILVHPSRREGLARALPQGGLAGVPVVAYDVDGNKEGLEPGVSGILLPAFDVGGLRDAMARLVGDAELRRRMGAAGREFAMKRFDAKVMVEALDRVYRGEVEEKGNSFRTG
jgi:glycosyltransferase involved in cell wall biosynthesis